MSKALDGAQAARFADTDTLFQALGGGGQWNRTDAPPAKTSDVQFVP